MQEGAELPKNNFLISLKNRIRWWLMPGLDLFTRRRVRLSWYWLRGNRKVLDAGSGNGWFSYLAYRSGATVIAVNIAEQQVKKAFCFYNLWRRIPSERLKFLKMDLRNLNFFEAEFDEIICYEVLEHIRDDVEICRTFWKILKPGGYLHLCCPYAEHPRWHKEVLHPDSDGFHVRRGYTLESYRALLEPIGFRITTIEGMGGVVLAKLSIFIEALRIRFGDVWCLPFLILAIPIVRLDPRKTKTPYSLYVKAVKPVDNY
jgi:SAM-dependent methyltransferase